MGSTTPATSLQRGGSRTGSDSCTPPLRHGIIPPETAMEGTTAAAPSLLCGVRLAAAAGAGSSHPTGTTPPSQVVFGLGAGGGGAALGEGRALSGGGIAGVSTTAAAMARAFQERGEDSSFRQRSMMAAKQISALSEARVVAEAEALSLARAQVRALQEARLAEGRDGNSKLTANNESAARLKQAQEAVRSRELAMARARAEVLEAKAMEARMQAEALGAAAAQAAVGSGVPPSMAMAAAMSPLPTSLGRSFSQPIGGGSAANPLALARMQALVASGEGGNAFGRNQANVLMRMQEEAVLWQQLMMLRQQRASVATVREMERRRCSVDSTGSAGSSAPLLASQQGQNLPAVASMASDTGTAGVGGLAGARTDESKKSKNSTVPAAAASPVLCRSSSVPHEGAVGKAGATTSVHGLAQEMQERNAAMTVERAAKGDTSEFGATALPKTTLGRGSSVPVAGSMLDRALGRGDELRIHPEEIDEDEAESQGEGALSAVYPMTNLARAASQPREGTTPTAAAHTEGELAVLNRLKLAKEAALKAVEDAAAAAEAAKKVAEQATNQFEAALRTANVTGVISSQGQENGQEKPSEEGEGVEAPAAATAALPMTTMGRSATAPVRSQISEAKEKGKVYDTSFYLKKYREESGDPAESIEQRVSELWAARNAEDQAQTQTQPQSGKERAPPLVPFARVVTSDNEEADNDECHDDLINDDDDEESAASPGTGAFPQVLNRGPVVAANVAMMAPPPLPTMRRVKRKKDGNHIEQNEDRKRRVPLNGSLSLAGVGPASETENDTAPTANDTPGAAGSALLPPQKKRKASSAKDVEEEQEHLVPPPPPEAVRASSASALDLLTQAAVTRIGK